MSRVHGRWIPLVGILGTLSACVTVNIYFPASAAQKAADKIIEQIYQSKHPPAEKTATPPVPATSPTSPGH
ncbi:MAG: hypothetical protein M0037_14725 [Betaproteobacteria bacterium]|nr:hypothetical protein [Betaproteobacteria bacterium]